LVLGCKKKRENRREKRETTAHNHFFSPPLPNKKLANQFFVRQIFSVLRKKPLSFSLFFSLFLAHRKIKGKLKDPPFFVKIPILSKISFRLYPK